MYTMSDEEFEAAIAEALDAMPDQFLEALENVAVVWDYEPNEYHLGFDGEEGFSDETAGFDGANADDCEVGEGAFEGEEVFEDEGAYEGEDDDERLPDDLLGLFDGLSIVERAEGGYDDVPDVITVFKGPHERCFKSREEIVEEIGKTIIHELGHYFGLEDDRLYDMGY